MQFEMNSNCQNSFLHDACDIHKITQYHIMFPFRALSHRKTNLLQHSILAMRITTSWQFQLRLN